MDDSIVSARDRASAMRLMAFDVDGVLTDGTLWFTSAGDEMKGFSSADGHGLKMLREGGIELAIITGRRSRAVALRAENLGIARLHQGVEDKREVLLGIASQMGIAPQQCGYMGDDVVDLPILRACGFSATVPEGEALVKQHVHYVARRPAGRGAVREVCEFILGAQGRLDGLMARYLG
ncbi:MAG: phenylphosphate carboxylase subunit delta [Rhodocyclaceae bacterium]|jgi:3-deoxy-D-manno-octulosonate 8-phosphate phosphatase (KDO 8-P phosphatase)|nr:MAG: phenylphosphate carboxylase subunit delta [Rhodocyclaceae bacterium]